jgi:hypothetical protein
MICYECGNEVFLLKEIGSNNLCRICYNIYMADYRKANRSRVNQISRDSLSARRWLEGAERKDDMGKNLPKIRWY